MENDWSWKSHGKLLVMEKSWNSVGHGKSHGKPKNLHSEKPNTVQNICSMMMANVYMRVHMSL